VKDSGSKRPVVERFGLTLTKTTMAVISIISKFVRLCSMTSCM